MGKRNKTDNTVSTSENNIFQLLYNALRNLGRNYRDAIGLGNSVVVIHYPHCSIYKHGDSSTGKLSKIQTIKKFGNQLQGGRK